MTKLQLLDDFLNPVLAVPVGEKTYRFKAMSAANALFIQNLRDQADKATAEGKNLHDVVIKTEGEDEDDESYMRRVFGDTYSEMVEDGLSHIVIFRLSQIIMAWTFYGVESAQAFVDNGGKAVTPKKAPQDRKPPTATRTRTAAGNTTRKRNSATTTSSPKATPSKAPAAVGPKSSATGTPSKPTSKTSA
jgi:hypothetical protein